MTWRRARLLRLVPVIFGQWRQAVWLRRRDRSHARAAWWSDWLHLRLPP